MNEYFSSPILVKISEKVIFAQSKGDIVILNLIKDTCYFI